MATITRLLIACAILASVCYGQYSNVTMKDAAFRACCEASPNIKPEAASRCSYSQMETDLLVDPNTLAANLNASLAQAGEITIATVADLYGCFTKRKDVTACCQRKGVTT